MKNTKIQWTDDALCSAEQRGYERGVRECVELVEDRRRKCNTNAREAGAGTPAHAAWHTASTLLIFLKQGIEALLPTEQKGTDE